MSKQLQKNKNNYQNYLTLNNGCKVVFNDCKSMPHCGPQNILTDHQRQIWLSNQLPAVCIIDMKAMIDKPVCYNRIGFYCWHEYQSNPKLIQIEYTPQDNQQNAVWIVLSKIRLQLTNGWQHFKLPLIASKNISFLKIKMMQNHSEPYQKTDSDNEEIKDSKTYLNQVSLGFVQQVIESRVKQRFEQRQKTYSDFRKMNTQKVNSQKQIRKLSQKLKHLTNENQILKNNINNQNNIIIKLQQTISQLTQTIGKLQNIQSTHQQKISFLLGKEPHKSNVKQKNKKYSNNDLYKNELSNNKKKIQQFFNDQSEIVGSHQDKNHSHSRQNNSRQNQKRKSKHNSRFEQQESQMSKHNSIYKSNKGKSNHKSNQSKKIYKINDNINQSQNNQSEYEEVVNQITYKFGRDKQKNSQYKENKEKYSQQRTNFNKTKDQKQKAYIPMLQKLQQLILLRDEKKNRLKNKNKHKRSNVIISSSNSSQNSSDEHDN